MNKSVHDKNVHSNKNIYKAKEIWNDTYKVTPLLQISTLKPANFSRPFAISGGWKAGDPWLV